jgi:hypothetical protein
MLRLLLTHLFLSLLENCPPSCAEPFYTHLQKKGCSVVFLEKVKEVGK